MSISHLSRLNSTYLTMNSLYRNILDHTQSIENDFVILQDNHFDQVLNETFIDCEMQSETLKETLREMIERVVELREIHKQKEEEQN